MFRNNRRGNNRRARRSGGGLSMGRLLVGLLMAAFALISYFGSSVYNPVTGETQYISITQEQEIALGLEAAPQLAQQFGGLHPDPQARAYLDAICERLLQGDSARELDYPFQCHLLADTQTINAFALPGGQVFITAALFNELDTEGQVAGVMGHEIGHVVGRHSAEQIAKQELTQGLTGAVVIASYDPENPNSAYAAQMSMIVGQLINMRYSRQNELEADRLGVRFLAEAGYDPRSLIRVMEVLESAGGDNRQPEFFSTHPNPENRIENIQQAIAAEFPEGVPDGLRR
jgi:beta-barrel assembly-enhancing protease